MNKTAYRAIWEIILAILFLISILFTLISVYESLDYFSDRTTEIYNRHEYIGLTQKAYAYRQLFISVSLITLLTFQLKYLVSRNTKQIIIMILISIIYLLSLVTYDNYLDSISVYIHEPKG